MVLHTTEHFKKPITSYFYTYFIDDKISHREYAPDQKTIGSRTRKRRPTLAIDTFVYGMLCASIYHKGFVIEK